MHCCCCCLGCGPWRNNNIGVRPPGCIRTKKNKADGRLRTAGSDKHNKPQQYNAYGCVAHGRCMGGSLVTLLPVHVVGCTTWYTSGLCAHGRLRQKMNNILPVPTYKIRPPKLEPGKSSRPHPPGKKKTLGACHALHTARIAPGHRSVCPAGLPVSTTQAFRFKSATHITGDLS